MAPPKRFSFRLEPVLKYRSEKEEQAVMAQAGAQVEYHKQLGVLDEVRIGLEMARATGPERITGGECLARSLYIEYLTGFQEKQEEAVERARLNLEKKRQAVIDARMDKLVLEKLKEKSYSRHVEELNRWEIKTIDDQCTVLTHRKSGFGE